MLRIFWKLTASADGDEALRFFSRFIISTKGAEYGDQWIPGLIRTQFSFDIVC